MADLTGIEVIDMPSASQVNTGDYFMIVQSGVNKKATKAIVLDGIATEDETGNKIDLEINSSTYVMVAKLYDKNNVLLSTSSPIDLPLETMVVNAEYDEETKEIVLILKNGNTVRFSVADLIDGLVSEDTFEEAIAALQNEISNIASQITTTDTREDTELSFNDTFDARIKSTIKGNISQFTTTGKNIFNLADLSGNTISNKTTTGFTFTKVGTSRFTNTIQLAKAIPSGTTIYLSGTITSDTSTSSLFVQFGTDSNFNTQASSHLNAYKNLTIEVNYIRLYYLNTEESGVSCNVDKMQIEIGSSATSYEPYTRKYSGT